MAALRGAGPKKTRTRYSAWQKQQVLLHYPSCKSVQDKQDLADRLGIPSLDHLYNLASRIGATQGHEHEAHTAAVTDEKRLLQRDDPALVKFSAKDDNYIRSNFGRRRIEAIAFYLHRTETAVLYRARKLGLRKPVRYWDITKVARWLGMTIADLHAARIEGLDIYSLHDPRGVMQIEVVSTTSLWRWLDANPSVLDGRNPDAFFLRELEESKEIILRNPNGWESCTFLLHGHVCGNPYATKSYGLYCPNNERYRAGEDPKCMRRLLDIDDEGLRGASGTNVTFLDADRSRKK